MAVKDRDPRLRQARQPSGTAGEKVRPRQGTGHDLEPVGAAAQVHDGRDLAARLQDPGGDGGEQRAAAGDDRPFPRKKLLRLQEDGRGGEPHDQRRGPAGKGNDALVGADRGDERLGLDPLGPQGAQRIEAEAAGHEPHPTPHHRAHPAFSQPLTERVADRRLGRGAADAGEARREGAIDLPAGCGRLVQEGHVEPGLRGGERRLDPRGPGAEHGDVDLGRPHARSVPIRMPACTGTMQACARRPSTSTRHS